MRNRRDSAFTLIELLLVVAIISLLISILLPALKFSYAKDSVCTANLKNIQAATFSYTLDQRGYLPLATDIPADTSKGRPDLTKAWVRWGFWDINNVRTGSLYTYMGRNEAAYVCPVFAGTPRSWWLPEYQNHTPAFTYALNEYASLNSSNPSVGWRGARPLRTLKRVREADKLHMFSDENPWVHPIYSNHAINNGAMGVGGYGPTGGSPVDCIGSFHKPIGGDLNNGYSNVLFFDGHVDLVHVSDTMEVVTPYHVKFPTAP